MNSVIEELQRTIFERQGVAGPWGIQCLGRVNAHYKANVELLSEFYSFVSKCGNIPITPFPPCYSLHKHAKVLNVGLRLMGLVSPLLPRMT